jgi:signal transduction histidine kinase
MRALAPLLDRSEELSRLDRAWDTANSNQAVLVFVSGGAGIGKTTFLDEWVARSHPNVRLTMDFAGNYGATTSALIESFQAVLDELVQDHVRWKEDLLEGLGREGSGIREVFPGFAGNTWFQPAAMLLDGEQLNRRFLQLLKSLLSVWSRCYGTVLITVENWHLAEAPLQGLLLQLSQDQIPLLCVATSREPLIRREAAQKWHVIEIALAAFSHGEVRKWIAGLFPDENTPRREFLTELCEHARGNPLHLQEILRVESRQQTSEMVRVSLESWLDRRVRDLEAPMRRFLEAGAILGSAFLASTALECAGLDRGLSLLVAEGVQRRFVWKSEQDCAWVHDLIRDAVLRSIEPTFLSAVSWRAVMHIVRQQFPTTEQILMLPTYFRMGRGSSTISAEIRGRIVQLVTRSSMQMRRMLNHSGARETLALLREFIAEQGLNVADGIWMLSAQVAFEGGDVAESIVFLRKLGRNLPPVLRIQKELMLCRSFYVTRDLAGIFARINSFSRVWWPAKALGFFGSSAAGFMSMLLLPLLFSRMKNFSPRRVSRKRDLMEHLHIAMVFFAFQHDHSLSSAIGLVFALRSILLKPSFNLPMAGVVIGMFGNLPRMATRLSCKLAQVSRTRQSGSGNAFWNDRFEFVYHLFYAHQFVGVKSAMASLGRMNSTGSRVFDPEVEVLVKFNLIALYFWSDASMQALSHEILSDADLAMKNHNPGLESVFRAFGTIVANMCTSEGVPYFPFKDPADEQRLFKAWNDAKEYFVASGLRIRQAFFALLVGDHREARGYVESAEAVRRDTSYWVPRIFDSYTECIAKLLAVGSDSIWVPYGILKSTVTRNPRQFRPYLTHVDAERARKKGLRDAALRLYQKAREDFHRLERPVLAALVDWRTGDLFWEESDREIARAYLARAQRGFAGCGMSSSVNAIRSKYGLEAPSAPIQEGKPEEYLTAALRLHRLTLLGKLAAETAREIRDLNHSARVSADFLQKDLAALRTREDLASAIEHVAPTLRVIQESSAKIDLYLDQFHLAGGEPSTSAGTMVNLGDVIQAAVEVMARVIRTYTRKFHNGLVPRRVFIRGEAFQIDQVVMNLILNACESLPGTDHGVTLEWASDPDDHLVGFRVADQGRGIPADILPRVTEPFFTTKRDRGGTGLGLALCKRIVESHKGSLRIDSQPGVGSTVTVLFPRAEGPEHTEKLS